MTLGGTITHLAAHDAVDGSLLDHLLDHYFLVRRLPWRGSQEARRSPADRDPERLAQFRQCLAEADRRRKVERYEALARLTTAPVGELRTLVATAVNPGLRGRAGGSATGDGRGRAGLLAELARGGDRHMAGAVPRPRPARSAWVSGEGARADASTGMVNRRPYGPKSASSSPMAPPSVSVSRTALAAGSGAAVSARTGQSAPAGVG